MPEITPTESQALRRLVARETGLSFDSSGLSRLHGAVQQRLAACGCAAVADYLRLLESARGPSELAELVDLITVPETRFFRDPRQFALLRDQVLPELARARRAAGEPPRLRLWSAACATGEEAYSLALVALEALPGWQVQVLATDISQRWLRIAARGRYPARRLEQVPPALRARYFEQRGDEFTVGPQLRAAVTFQRVNLVGEHLVLAVPPPMDVILCENVLIYLEREAIGRLATRLHSALRDDGYLLLSVSESLWRGSSQFALEVRDGVFLHRKAPPVPEPVAPSPPGSAAVRHSAPPPPRAPVAPPVPRADGRGGPRSPAPPSAPSLLAEAERLADRGALREARAVVAQACAAAPLDARAHALEGTLAAQLGELDAAARALERAVYLDPTVPETFYHLGTVYRRLGRLERARRAWRQALRLLDHPPSAAGEHAATRSLLAEACRRLLQAL
jgi:chemotaxis protein methyltransferase CheR